MINTWLQYNIKSPKPTFTIAEISEKKAIDDDIKRMIQKEILDSYRGNDFFKKEFQHEKIETLVDYLKNNVLPSKISGITKNVWQGDVGEILAGLIVAYFQKYYIPIKKMRWKFNKDRSVFCTDMIAHNDDITSLYYYEIKTRKNIKNKETRKLSTEQKNDFQNRKKNLKLSANGNLYTYVSVHAHDSLLKDEESPTESIIDFLFRFYYRKAEDDDIKEEYKQVYREKADKYGNIAKNITNPQKHFELFFISEKINPSEIKEIVEHLNSYPPELSPLNITIVLINNFKNLIDELRDTIINEAINQVYNK
ncbi:hypothetical protein KAR28_01970 [Candidatus Parcubacteria bacterium]|nr:hypothetical protein [Candidatus Parcubacteria bacterium]